MDGRGTHVHDTSRGPGPCFLRGLPHWRLFRGSGWLSLGGQMEGGERTRMAVGEICVCLGGSAWRRHGILTWNGRQCREKNADHSRHRHAGLESLERLNCLFCFSTLGRAVNIS